MNRLRPRDWVLISILLIVCLVCVRLGFWQLERLEQRLTRNAQIERRMRSTPAAFEVGLQDYTPINIMGTFRPEFEVLLQNRARDDVPGYHLITPLEVEPGNFVLIDRGWIPYEEGSSNSLGRYVVDGQVRIEGILLPGQEQPRWKFLADPIPAPGEPPLRTWRILDIAGLQGQMPATLHDQYVAVTAIEAGSSPVPIPDFEPDLSNGPHLSYSIQWFSFGAIALIGGAVMLRNRIRIR